MLEALLSGGLGTILGGITGLIGTHLNNKKELKLAVLEQDERRDKRAHDLAMLDRTHEYNLKTAEVENEHMQELSADSNMRESYKLAQGEVDGSDSHGGFIKGLLGFTEVVRRWIRVVASFGSMVILGYLTSFVYQNLDKFLVQLQQVDQGVSAFQLMHYLVMTICYVSTTVILWWFGARTKRPPTIK